MSAARPRCPKTNVHHQFDKERTKVLCRWWSFNSWLSLSQIKRHHWTDPLLFSLFFDGSAMKSALPSFRLDSLSLCLIMDCVCVCIRRRWYRPRPSKVKDRTMKCDTGNNHMKNLGVRNISCGNALRLIINQKRDPCCFRREMNVFLSCLCLLLLGGCRMSGGGFQKNSAEYKLLSVCLFRPSRLPVDRRLQTLIFKAPFSGWREIFSLKCPTCWLSEITPHISSIGEEKEEQRRRVAAFRNIQQSVITWTFCLLVWLEEFVAYLLSSFLLHLTWLISLIPIWSACFQSSSFLSPGNFRSNHLSVFSAVGHKPEPLWKAFQDKQALNIHKLSIVSS